MTIELLAPAGSREALIAALDAGADAVYLGAAFSARAYAENFDGEALVEAVSYAHVRGKRVYITLNTLIRDDERRGFMDQLAWVARAGVDAALVQDVAVLDILREALPGLPLHASTQMGIHNAQGAAWAARSGFVRAVLARECALEEIGAIRDAVGDALELEAFCHGALCVSVSGQCLMSSIAGGRSGNRGRCAQPCRMPYTLEGEIAARGALLSPRDLCLLEHLESLRRAGVTCIKIEGRMKSAGYVGTVVGAYRRALDGAARGGEASLARSAFRRRGYGTGYLYGVRDAEYLAEDLPAGGIEEPDGGRGPEPEPLRVPVIMRFSARVGAPMILEADDGTRSVRVEGTAAETPRSAPLERETVVRSLTKTGDTPFAVASLEIDMEPIFAPVSAVNRLRREAVGALACRRIEAMRAWTAPEWTETGERGCDAPAARGVRPKAACSAAEREIFAQVSGVRAAAALRAGLSVLWQPEEWHPDALSRELARFPEEGAGALWLAPPPFLPTEALAAVRLWAEERAHRFAGYVAANPAHIGWLPWPAIAGAPLHTLSAGAALGWMERGFARVTISPEANRHGARTIAEAVPSLIPAQGRLPLMLLRHCPYRAARGEGGRQTDCTACGVRPRRGLLRDHTGRGFPLDRYGYAGGCVQRVLNADILRLDARRISGMSPLLYFWDESTDFIALSARVWRAGVGGRDPTAQDAAAWRAAWEGIPVTAGHWHRGIE